MLGYDLRKRGNPSSELERNLGENLLGFTEIFTDGAFREDDFVGGAGVYFSELNQRFGVRLSDCFSAMSAELWAIHKALSEALSLGVRKMLILTDSLSAIKSITHRVKKFSSD